MALFFIFVTNLLNLYRGTLLMHNSLSDDQGNKIKSILKVRIKPSQNQFFQILCEVSKNLKKSARSFHVGVHFHPGQSQPDTSTVFVR